MRKSFPKILIILFLSVFILQIICLFFLLATPVASQASGTFMTQPGDFTPQVELPGFNFDKNDSSTGNIANLIKAIYNYAIGIVGILAAVVLMVGGVLWIMAGGNATQIGEAKAWIGAALTGLVLALTSYLILNTVNPALVNLQTTDITKIGKLIKGSCTLIEAPYTCTNNIEEKQCIASYATFVEDGKCPNPCCSFIINDRTQQRSCNDNTATLENCKGPNASFLPNATCDKNKNCISNK